MTRNDHKRNNTVIITKRTYNLNPIYTIEQYNNHAGAVSQLWMVSSNYLITSVVINQLIIRNTGQTINYRYKCLHTSVIGRQITTAVVLIWPN